MRPTEVLTYAMLGLAGSVAAQADSSQDDNGLVARSHTRHNALTGIIAGGRSPGIAGGRRRVIARSVSEEDEHQLDTRSPMNVVSPALKASLSGSHRRGRGRRSVSDDDEHQLDARSPIQSFRPPSQSQGIIKAPSYVTSGRRKGRRSVSDDGEHQLDTRSPIRGIRPSGIRPGRFRFNQAKLARRSVSDDDEHQLDTRSPIRGIRPSGIRPGRFRFNQAKLARRSVSDDDEHHLDTRSPIRRIRPSGIKPLAKSINTFPIKLAKKSFEGDELVERAFDAEEFEQEY